MVKMGNEKLLPEKAIADHVDDEDKSDGVTIRDSIGRMQNPIIISESCIIYLIDNTFPKREYA